MQMINAAASNRKRVWIRCIIVYFHFAVKRYRLLRLIVSQNKGQTIFRAANNHHLGIG